VELFYWRTVMFVHIFQAFASEGAYCTATRRRCAAPLEAACGRTAGQVKARRRRQHCAAARLTLCAEGTASVKRKRCLHTSARRCMRRWRRAACSAWLGCCVVVALWLREGVAAVLLSSAAQARVPLKRRCPAAGVGSRCLHTVDVGCFWLVSRHLPAHKVVQALGQGRGLLLVAVL
jgi:hypothetical protein